MDLEYLRRKAGLSRSEACRLLNIHPSTWRRWKRQKTAPRAVQTLLELLGGQLPNPHWQEWRFAQGKLWGPDGQGYTPEEILSLNYLKQLVAEIQRKASSQT